MPNDNRNKKNQPPTGEGKKQSTQLAASRKLDNDPKYFNLLRLNKMLEPRKRKMPLR